MPMNCVASRLSCFLKVMFNDICTDIVAVPQNDLKKLNNQK